MKLVLLSDGHLSLEQPEARLDNIGEVGFAKFEFVLQYARSLGKDVFVLQAGDLCNSPRSWFVLPLLTILLKKYQDVKLGVLWGQHDTYMYSKETRVNTMLGVLECSGLVQGLDEEGYLLQDMGGEDVAIYGCNHGQKIPEVKFSSYLNVLVIHAPISEEALFPGHAYLDARNFLEANKDFDLILCGDIHRKFVSETDGRVLINTGPMIRREATQYNFKHEPGFFVFDTDSREYDWVNIPHRPAIEVLSADHIEEEKKSRCMLEKFIQSVSSKEVSEVSFVDILWELVGENNAPQEIIDLLSEAISRVGRKGGENG